jgi:Tfp pilus assembly protein PilZ
MNNRRAERTRKRLACTLLLGDAKSTGLIVDVSANGLFVQTGANFGIGDPVTLELEAPGSFETLTLEGRVVREKPVPARLRSLVQPGIGIRIEQAPEGFYAMVAALQDAEKKPAGARKAAVRPCQDKPGKKPAVRKPLTPAPEPQEKQPVLKRLRKRYRVEVHEIGGRGARLIEVEAMNVAGAGRRALEEVGEGWKVAGCELD